MNKQKTLLAFVVLVVVLVGWILWVNNPYPVNTPTPTLSSSPESTVSPLTKPFPIEAKNMITYTDSGYVPSTITIKKGETVIWKNESSNSMWTASAMHPLHKAYPGTDITACGTQTLIPMFDSCVGVSSGQSWSFIFNNVGTWGYHNHLDASKFGKVVVE